MILTRARQGMVIFVPKGGQADITRPPDFYDETFALLKRCGLEEVEDADLKLPSETTIPLHSHQTIVEAM